MINKFSRIRIRVFEIALLLLGINVHAQPEIPVLSSPADYSIQLPMRPVLSWYSSSGADKYTLQVSSDSLFGTSSLVYNDTSILDTFRQVGLLANNRTYYWRVSAKNGDGSSAFSGKRRFTTLPAPAVQTTTIIKSFTSPGSYPRGLAWDGDYLWIIDDVKNIYKCDTSGTIKKTFEFGDNFDRDISWDGTGLWIGGASDDGGALKIDANGNRVDSLPVHYSDSSGIEWDGRYFWFGDYGSSYVRMHKKDGSLFRNWPTDEITGRPTGISYDGIRLWIGGSGGTSSNYIYKYSILGDLIYSFDLNNIGIEADHPSFNSLAWDGKSLWYASDESFTIYRLSVPYYHEAPAVPVNLSPDDGAEEWDAAALILKWSTSPDATTYHLQVSMDQTFTSVFFEDSTLTDTWSQVGPLEDATTYYWHVRAKNSGGISNYSDVFSFTIYNDPPSNPSGLIALPGNEKVRLIWNRNSEPDINKYRIYRDQSSPATTLTDSVTGSPPDTFHVDTDVMNDSLYFFRIVAVDDFGEKSGFSNEAVAVPVIEQGNAVLLDGNDDHIDVGTGNSLDDPGSAFTVEGWMYYQEALIDRQIFGSVSDGEERRISLRSNAFTIQPDGQNYTEVVMDNPVDTGWHHLAGTYDGSHIRLYVDGVLYGINSVNGMLDPLPTSNCIGRQEGSGWYMNGQIDEICIWDVALSGEEIRNTICRPVQANSPGLVALWHFDETETCLTAYDASTNMIHGTLMNGASFTRSQAMAPITPSGFGIYEYLEEGITLKWNASMDYDLRNYRIYRDTISPASVLYDSVYGSPPDTLYTDTDVDSGKTYYYRITAVDSSGNESAFSEQLVLGGGIIVDGIRDPFWETATAHIHLGQNELVDGEMNDENDFSADLYLAYDSVYLYGFVEVKDDSISSKSDHNWSENDAFSMKLDLVPDSVIPVDWDSWEEPNGRDIISIEFQAETGIGEERNGTGNTVVRRAFNDSGYIVEFAIPETDIVNHNTDPNETILLQESTQVGFYFEMFDQDEESSREAMLAWGHSSVNYNSARNVTQFGSMSFLAGNQISLSNDNMVISESEPYIQVPHIASSHWMFEQGNKDNWKYYLYVYVNDPQGLDDIDSVWVEGPGDTHFHLFDNGTNGDDQPGNDGKYQLELISDSPIPTGIYSFYVKDKSGNLLAVSDSLTSNLECPLNFIPADNSIISEPDFLIEWDEVPGVIGYSVQVSLLSNWESYWRIDLPVDSTSVRYNVNGEGKELIEGEVYYLEIHANDIRNTSHIRVRIAYMIQSNIVIDGMKDPFWDVASAHIHLGKDELVWGEADNEDDFSADLYLTYDSVYLYGYVEVKDDRISSKTDWYWWENDAMSLKFDTYPDSVIPVPYNSDDEPNRQDVIKIDFTAETGFGDERNGNENTILSRALTDTGYVIEFAVSETGLKNLNTDPPETILLQEGTQIGFYFEVADQDEETEKEAVLGWGHVSANLSSRNDVSQFGSMTFLADNQIQLSRNNLVMSEDQPYIQVPHVQANHIINENSNEWWDYYLYIYANDQQGLSDIDSVWVEGPHGNHYRLYDNQENGDNYGGDGRYCYRRDVEVLPAIGIYHFYAVDHGGNEVFTTDTLTGLLDCPENLIPANNTIVSDPDFLIDWDAVSGATSYWIEINLVSHWENYWYIDLPPDQTSVHYNVNGEGKALVEGEIYYMLVNAGNGRNYSQTGIKFTYTTQGLIVIDGTKEPFWDTATGHIHLGEDEVVWGNIDDENDCSADLYLAYDHNFLYGFVEVKDDSISSKADWDFFENDALSLKFDPVPDSTISVSLNSWEHPNMLDIVNIDMTAETGFGADQNGNENTLVSRTLTENGYMIEFAISAAGLVNNNADPPETILFQEGTQVGFYFEMADQDTVSSREASLAWGHTSANINSRWNVTQYGSMTFISGNQIQLSHDNLVMSDNEPYIQVPSVSIDYNCNEHFNEWWSLNLYVFVNDPQGLGDLDSVWVENPDGIHYLLYDDFTHCDDQGSDGKYQFCGGPGIPVSGAYHFFAVDQSGNTVSVTDTALSILDRPRNITPVNYAIITEPDFMISWDEVPGATKYAVDVHLAPEWDGYWNIDLDPDCTSVQYNENGSGRDLVKGEIYYLSISADNDKNRSSTTQIFTYRTDDIHRRIYVNGNNDSGIEHGSRDFPFNTIQEGINATLPGDTVLVYPDMYIENINIGNKDVVLGSLFLITDDTSFIGRTVIDGNQNNSVINVDECYDTIVISGFTIKNGLCEHGGGFFIGNSKPTVLKNLVIDNNIANSSAGAIYIHETSKLVIIENSKICNNYNGAIRVYDPQRLNKTIIKNTIFENNISGCTFDGSPNEINFINTLFIKNTGNEIINVDNSSGKIINSTIADNTNGEIRINTSIEIRNCIFWNNGGYNIESGHNIRYSLIEGGASGTGNINTDPLFIDTVAGDYWLKVVSPCLNMGTPDTAGLNLPVTDLAGNPRISGGRIDMGAYEYNEEMIAVLQYADTTITIDGAINENIWQRSDKYYINKIFTGEVFDGPEDLSAYWKAVWDEDGIYVLVEVTADDTLVTDGTYGQVYEQDRIDIYLDMNTDNLEDGLGPSTGINTGNPTNGHYQFSFNRRAEFATLLEWQTGCDIAIVENENNATSVQELFVPWSLITDAEGNEFIPVEDVSIGFDVYIADNDGPDNGEARNRKVWVHDGTFGDAARFNMDHCGKIQLIRQPEEDLNITVSASSLTICPGEEVRLNVMPENTTGTYYYTWTSDQPGPAYTFHNPVVTPTVTTKYYIHVTDSTYSTTDSVTITVLPLPFVDAGPDTNILYNTTVTLSGSASGGSVFYSYNWSPADSFDYSFIQNPTTCKLRKSNLFTLSATDYGTGCTNTDQVLVTVTGGTLDADISVSRDTICLGESVKLLALPTGGAGNYSFSWSSDPQGFTSSLPNPSDTPSGDLTYKLVVSDGMNSDSTNLKIIVYSVPEPESPDVSICYGEPILPLTALGNNITWYADNTLSTIISMNDTLQTGLASVGEYSFYVTQTDKSCFSPAAEVLLSIIELPEVTINLSEIVIDPGETVQLIASGADFYSWTPFEGLNRTDGDTVRATPDENTKYTVTGTNIQGCLNIAEVSVYVYCEECDQEKIIFDTTGFIGYCPTNRVYPENVDCYWLIYPSGALSIYLAFDTIDIKPGDYVRLYNGFDEDSELLGEFDNDHKPSGQIQSESMLYIWFHSNESESGLGFRARYRTNQPVGIEEYKFISELNIYPNPVTGLLNIEFISPGEMRLTLNVFNTFLQLLRNEKIQAIAGWNHVILDMTGLPPGIYYLHISSEIGNTVRKIVVR